MEKLNNRLDKQFYRTMFSLGVPMVVQSLVTSFLNIVDTFMISNLSSEAIAGVGAANRVFFMLNLFLFGTSSGAAVLAAQFFGVKDYKSIKKVLGMTLIMGVCGATLVSVLAIGLPTTMMRIFTNEADVIVEGAKYLRIIGFSYIATAITFSFSFVLRSIHQVKLPVIVSIFSIGLNTFLNWVLIYGHLGFEPLGVKGAAIATVIARIGEMGILVAVVYSKNMPIAARLSELLDLRKTFVKKFFKTVSPVIANELIWAAGVTGYAMVYGRMGKTVMAAMTISQTIEQLAFIIFFGTSSAAAVMLGNALGANEMKKAETYAARYIRMFIILGIITSVILYFVSGGIADIYQVEPAVKETVKVTLSIFSLFITVKSLNLLIIVGILRSGGDTVAAMLIDTIAVWGVGLPLGILGGLILKLDIRFVYIMVLSEEAFKVIVSLIRYKSKKWMKNLVVDS